MSITILDKVGCAKAIKTLARNAAAVQARIHQVAVSALAHIRDHGDTTIATGLMDALPKGQRREALSYWFTHFSNEKFTMKQDKESGKWVGNLAKLKDRSPEDFRVDESMLTTFAELTKEKKVGSTFTVEQLVKKLTTLANEDGVNEDGSPKVEEAARDMAANLLAMVEGAKPRLKLVA